MSMSTPSLIVMISYLFTWVSPSKSFADMNYFKTTGQYKGYVQLQRVIQQRILHPQSPFEIGNILGESYQEYGSNLLDLLGTYKSANSNDEFHNGTPNSVSILLWHVILSGFSQMIGHHCVTPDPNLFQSHFEARLGSICEGALDSSSLFDYWLSLMSFDAPILEFLSWEEFVKSPELRGLRIASPSEWVATISMAVFLNPFFILNH